MGLAASPAKSRTNPDRDGHLPRRHDQTEAEIDDDVLSLQKEAESYGTLHDGGSPSVGDMFEGVYKEKPPHLRDQRKESGA